MIAELIPGLEFAKRHDLTNRETEILLQIIAGPKTIIELSESVKRNKDTIYQTIFRLKLKNIIKTKTKDEKKNIIYELNEEIF